MAERRVAGNPFRYGREVEPLVDREEELHKIITVAERCGTLFFIGPRRYGKTSILRAAEKKLSASGDMVVLRYDCEAYEDVRQLAEALLAGAVRRYSGAFERAQAIAKKFFLALKPSLSIEPVEGRITVQIGVDRAARASGVPLLADVLNGIEKLAVHDQRNALVILDEFQQVVSESGERAERQIRAAVQTQQHVGYVFAGSSSRMLTEMIGSSARAFWQLGDSLHLGPIPRPDFVSFLRHGFEKLERAGTFGDAALLHLLDVAEDVPYNVQQLASECWTLLLEGPQKQLTAALVDQALARLLSAQHVTYLQRWLALTHPQKQTLAALATSPPGFQLTTVARHKGLPRSTMQTALEALERMHFVRQDLAHPRPIWRFDDPFMRIWLVQLRAEPPPADS